MSNLGARIPIVSLFVYACGVLAAADHPDYSKEAAVVENMATDVRFSATGARDWRQTLSVRIQSESAVRQFGILSFSYGAESDRLQIDYVRVRKADGSVVVTPESSVMDVATEVAANAPTYSDLRQKQVPVKALGVGDILEYSVRDTQLAPEAQGQFWFQQNFDQDGVILSQTLQIIVPKEDYVQVASPVLKSETREEGDEKIYFWKHSQLEPTDPNPKKPAVVRDPLQVQITTFKNWQEVGEWWSSLASPQTAVTPALQAKADELTGGLVSDLDKAKAIYNYVALKYRYISISLGAGRYRPHAASEVFANQYGDCKDKHSLFAALLKAAGVQAWPALLGVNVPFNAAVPSPGQFNHVITVIPDHGKYLWLDTTTEVAPFGLLSSAVRDQQALVIPTNGKPFLMKTPADAPALSSDSIDMQSSLSDEGTLTGHFDFKMAGDNALLFRSVFRQLAPVQWQVALQQASYSFGFAGDVSRVQVENLEEPDKPLQFSYDYTRKDFSDWPEHKLTLPIPMLTFGPGYEAEQPKEPFPAGSKGSLTYRALVHLPNAFSVEAPADMKRATDFADYSAHYSFKDGALAAERRLTIKQAKVSVNQWEAYRKFIQDVQSDQTTFIAMNEPATNETAANKTGAASQSGEVDDLMRQAAAAIQAKKVDEAHALLAQVEKLNPKQPGLWFSYSFLAGQAGKVDECIADARKEIKFHPDNIQMYGYLSNILVQFGRKNEAIETLRSAVALQPEDRNAASGLSQLLMSDHRYEEIPDILEKPIAAVSDNEFMKSLRIEALLRSGQKEQSVAEAEALAQATKASLILNNLAFALADSHVALDKAADWAEKAVAMTEGESSKSTLDSFQQRDLNRINLLANEWDTLGWVYFAQDKAAKAQSYVDAAWRLSQSADIANHLGQIYEKEGKHDAALHAWRLALAADNHNAKASELLRNTTITPQESTLAAEELAQARTIQVPSLLLKSGTSEFFISVTKSGIDDAHPVDSAQALGNAASSLKTAPYEPHFPDDGPERLVRRGILSCSAVTKPSCQFTMLLPALTRGAANVPTPPSTSSVTPAVSSTPSNMTPAMLKMKVEPEYTKAARDAHIEGLVILKIMIGPDGIPDDLQVTKSLGFGLDEKAKESVKQWRFYPASKDGQPVAMAATVEVNFVFSAPR